MKLRSYPYDCVSSPSCNKSMTGQHSKRNINACNIVSISICMGIWHYMHERQRRRWYINVHSKKICVNSWFIHSAWVLTLETTKKREKVDVFLWLQQCICYDYWHDTQSNNNNNKKQMIVRALSKVNYLIESFKISTKYWS